MTRDPWDNPPPESGAPAPSQSDEMTGRLYSGLTPVRHGRHAARTVMEVEDGLGVSYVVEPNADDLADQAPPELCTAHSPRWIESFGIDPGFTPKPARARRVPAWVTPVVAWAWAIAAIVIAARVTVPSQGVTLGMGIAVGAAVGVLAVDGTARRYARRLQVALTRKERS